MNAVGPQRQEFNTFLNVLTDHEVMIGLVRIVDRKSEKKEIQWHRTGIDAALKAEILASGVWLGKKDYSGCDGFDGLSSRLARPFMFHTKLL
jgi:hypothetical protein